MLDSNLEDYILSLKDKSYKEKSFIIYQLRKMPDHYLFGVKLICLFLNITRLSPKNINGMLNICSSCMPCYYIQGSVCTYNVSLLRARTCVCVL